MDPLEACFLATPCIFPAAEVGSFFVTTAHRRTSYLRTVVVCSLVISSSESTKTSSPAAGDKMSRRSHIFPLSTQSFLFVFLPAHLFSRDSACSSRNSASMDLSRHGLGAEQTLHVPCCVEHIAGNIKQLALAGPRSEAAATRAFFLRGTYLSNSVSRVRSREEFHNIDTYECNTRVDAYCEDISC